MAKDSVFVKALRAGSVGEVVRGMEAVAEANGEARGAALSILRILDTRGLKVTRAQRERILSCKDLENLAQWIDASLDVISADEVFVARSGSKLRPWLVDED